MKKLFLFLLITSSLFMQSCGDDDPATSGITAVSGTWKALTLDGSLNSTTDFNGTIIGSESEIEGANFDYTLVLSDDSFTTMGSYDIGLEVTVNGGTQSSSDSYSGNGSGTYSVTDTEITVNGQFFEFEVNGMPFSSATGPQTSDYSISGDIMTISSTENMTTNQNGVTTTITSFYTSTWMKQ